MATSAYRRKFIFLMSAAAVAPLSLTPALADDHPPTPRMTEGPFYPRSFPADSDADLTQVQGRASRAKGPILEVSGRVVDRRGRPRAGSRVEIWQCDSLGQYHHVGEPEGDPDFQGFGAVTTDAEGRYRFRTIKPVPYPGRTPPGIYRSLGRDARLVTLKLSNAGHDLAGTLDIVMG